MSKKVYLDKTGRQGIFEGIKILHDAVCTTLGPSGKTVIIKNGMDEPIVTKDGVTVANAIDNDDNLKMAGILMVRKVSNNQDASDGDGTTSATILCHKMIERGFADFDKIEDIIDYKSGMQFCTQQVIEFIEANAIPVLDNIKMLTKIATISANNDIKLGKLVADAVQAAGKYGQVALIESIKLESMYEKEEGYIVDLGLADTSFGLDAKSGHFISNKKCHILLHTGKITSKDEWFRITKDLDKLQKNIIVLAQDYSTEILGFARHTNNILSQQSYKICLIKNGLREGEFKAIYDDLAAFTGATITEEYNDVSDLGDISNVVVKPGTMILGESLHSIDNYIDLLEERLQEEKSFYMQNNIKKRISRFRDGIVRLYIGGYSDIETKEAYHRAQDAIGACYAAKEKGIIPGGGHMLLYFQNNLYIELGAYSDSFKLGFLNINNSLSCIIEQIHKNTVKRITIDDILKIQKDESKSGNQDYRFMFGYDFKHHQEGDLISMGVVDPAKVVINTLLNATSVASTVLTTDCVIVEENIS